MEFMGNSKGKSRGNHGIHVKIMENLRETMEFMGKSKGTLGIYNGFDHKTLGVFQVFLHVVPSISK